MRHARRENCLLPGTGVRKCRRSRVAATERAGGFTLIEVLVVVGIIALLISILVPSLSGARREAQAAACLSNLKQINNGLQMHLLEAGMRRERVSTNYGWATYSYRLNKGAGQLFACPADANPKPVPPLFADIYEQSSHRGRAASDGVFNTIKQAGGGMYTLDIQDSVNDTWFGRDAGSGDEDLVLSYTVSKGAANTTVSVKRVESGWDFKVYDFKGRQLWDNPRSATNSHVLPLMWLSYGANASAGLRNVKGNPILIIESKNPGCFPENFAVRGGRKNDNLKQVLRFRHGGRQSNAGFKDSADPEYAPHQRINAAFVDGHAERMLYSQLVGPGPSADPTDPTTGEPIYHRTTWIGIRRSSEVSFD